MNARSYFVYVLSDNGTPFYAAPAVIARGEQVEKATRSTAAASRCRASLRR